MNVLLFCIALSLVTSENIIVGKPHDTDLKEKVIVMIEGVSGSFSFDPLEKSLVSTEIYKDGHFSIFDCLVYLGNEGKIDLKYHFEEKYKAFVIDSLNGDKLWWYHVHYDGGGDNEESATRMSYYMVKDSMYVSFYKVHQSKLDHKYEVFEKEVKRKEGQKGKLILPSVLINRTKTTHWTWKDLEVTPHNLRSDVFQDGVFTSADIILTLGDQNQIKDVFLWYEKLWNGSHPHNPVIKSYRVESVNDYTHSGACGFVYENGEWVDEGWSGDMNHVQIDERILYSPEFFEMYWIELGPC